MTSVYILFILQFLLDIVLIVLLLALFKKLKMADPARLQRLIEALEQGSKLAEKIEKNLIEKKALTDKLEKLIKHSERADKQPTPASKPPSKIGIDKQDQIKKLHKQGKKNAEISKITGIPIGEVELILSLEKAQKSSS